MSEKATQTLARGNSLKRFADSGNETVRAAAAKNMPMFQAAIKKDVYIGICAAYYAAEFDHAEMARYLGETNSVFVYGGIEGRIPRMLELAAWSGHTSVLEWAAKKIDLPGMMESTKYAAVGRAAENNQMASLRWFDEHLGLLQESSKAFATKVANSALSSSMEGIVKKNPADALVWLGNHGASFGEAMRLWPKNVELFRRKAEIVASAAARELPQEIFLNLLFSCGFSQDDFSLLLWGRINPSTKRRLVQRLKSYMTPQGLIRGISPGTEPRLNTAPEVLESMFEYFWRADCVAMEKEFVRETLELASMWPQNMPQKIRVLQKATAVLGDSAGRVLDRLSSFGFYDERIGHDLGLYVCELRVCRNWLPPEEIALLEGLRWWNWRRETFVEQWARLAASAVARAAAAQRKAHKEGRGAFVPLELWLEIIRFM
jgi:hypothetical protein